MPSEPDVRRHGLQWPPNRLQIFEGIVALTSTALFASVCVPLIEEPLRHFIGAAFGISIVGLASSAAYVSRCDPSARGESPTEASSKEIKDKAHRALRASIGSTCYACKIVKHYRTEHCSFCNRCVAGFDHHCIWLNNCIGGANYPAFVVVLLHVLVMTGIIVFTCLGLIAGDRLENDSIPKALTIVSMVVLIGLNFPLLVLDINLMAFQIGITMHSMTTMEYLRACNAFEKQQALQVAMESSGLPNPAEKGSSFRPLPFCIDWVIFRRRMPKSKSKVAAAPVPKKVSAPAPLAAPPPVSSAPEPPAEDPRESEGLEALRALALAAAAQVPLVPAKDDVEAERPTPVFAPDLRQAATGSMLSFNPAPLEEAPREDVPSPEAPALIEGAT